MHLYRQISEAELAGFQRHDLTPTTCDDHTRANSITRNGTSHKDDLHVLTKEGSGSGSSHASISGSGSGSGSRTVRRRCLAAAWSVLRIRGGLPITSPSATGRRCRSRRSFQGVQKTCEPSLLSLLTSSASKSRGGRDGAAAAVNGAPAAAASAANSTSWCVVCAPTG